MEPSADKSDAPIELHLRIRVLPGRRAAFFEFLREAIPVYESPGGIRISLLEDLTDENRFIEVVHYEGESIYWQDQERVAHDPGMRVLLDRWRAMLATPPEVEVFRRRTE